MKIIQIIEDQSLSKGFITFVKIGHVSIEVTINMVSKEEEEKFEWYFEEYGYFPFIGRTKAKEISNTIFCYGEKLFDQIFSKPLLRDLYNECQRNGINNYFFEIVGSPLFHSIHWETLKDPSMPLPLAFYVQIVRKVPQNNLVNSSRIEYKPSSTLNLLIVTARVKMGYDINPRTISRPIVELVQEENLPVNVHILRPGTYKSLFEHLKKVNEMYGPDYYNIIHLDVHGSLLTYENYFTIMEYTNKIIDPQLVGRNRLKPYDKQQPFVFLETENDGQIDAISAEDIVKLLMKYYSGSDVKTIKIKKIMYQTLPIRILIFLERRINVVLHSRLPSVGLRAHL